nr:hypothetical protein [Streptomyces sp. SID5468]
MLIRRTVRSLPAAVHVRALRLIGIPDPVTATHVRTTPDAVRRAAAIRPIGWDVERRLLAIPILPCGRLTAPTRSLGTRRRLAALMWKGWPPSAMADALGWQSAYIDWVLEGESTTRPITVFDRLKAATLYDHWWNACPEDHGVPGNVAHATRRTAVERGYASPLAWDDDRIEDPRARAQHGWQGGESRIVDHAAVIRALEGERVPLHLWDRAAAIEYGTRRRRMDRSAIALALGMKPQSVGRSWERIKAAAKARGETWPYDPTWALDRDNDAHRTVDLADMPGPHPADLQTAPAAPRPARIRRTTRPSSRGSPCAAGPDASTW